MTIVCKNYDFIVVINFLSEIPREKLQRVINKTLEVRDDES